MYSSEYELGGGDTDEEHDWGDEDPEEVEYKSEVGDSDPMDCEALFQYVL